MHAMTTFVYDTKYMRFVRKSRQNQQVYVDLGIYPFGKERYRFCEFGLLLREVGFKYRRQWAPCLQL